MTKLATSKIDPSRKGLFLVGPVEDKAAFAYCTGTTWEMGDPRCKGDARFFIKIPGRNFFIDCTESKIGKGHLMAQSLGSTAKATVQDLGDHVVFCAKGAYPAGEEMNFINHMK